MISVREMRTESFVERYPGDTSARGGRLHNRHSSGALTAVSCKKVSVTAPQGPLLGLRAPFAIAET